MNINQHFSNLVSKAAEEGANASELITQRDRLFKDKVIPELVKRNANDAAIVQARTKWNSQTNQVMQSAGLLPKNGQSSQSFAKDKRAEKAIKQAEKTGSKLPIIKETVISAGETVGNLFGQGVGGMIEGAAGFVRDVGENEKDSIAAKTANYGKNLKKGYQKSASSYQNDLQAGKHGKASQLAAGAVQSVPAMAMPFGVAKGATVAATKIPMLAGKAAYIGMGAGLAARHTQNYGEVRSNATANLQRDFPTWEKLQGNPIFEQRFQQLLNSGVNINDARKQAHTDTLDQISENAADKYGSAMTALDFIAPSGAVLGSGILKKAPTSTIGKALVGGGVASALVRREIAQSPRVGMAKLIPDVSVVANKEAAKMVGKQATEEGLQGGIGEYGAQAASANIGGTPVDYGKVGQTILEEGLIGGIMGGGMQSATGGSATSQAKDVAKQLRNQTNTLRQEEAAARKELADAMQLNDPEKIQSAHENLSNIGAAANKVKAAYDQYGIETPYFVQRFAAQYQPVQQEQQGLDQQVSPQESVQADPAAEVQPQAEPKQPEAPKPIQVNQGMADTTNMVMDSVTKGLISPEEAQAIQTDPLHGQVFSLAHSGDDAAANNIVINAASMGNISPDQAQVLIAAIPRYKNLTVPIKPSLSGIVDNHVKSQVNPAINAQDGGLFSNPVELDPQTLEPIDKNQPSPFQDNFNEPKQFMNPTRAKDYIRVNNLSDSHELVQHNDGMIEVRPRQNNIPEDPALNDFGYRPDQNMKPVAEDPNLTNFTDGIVDTSKLGGDSVPDVLDIQPAIEPKPQPTEKKKDFSKPKHFSNYIRAYHYVKENHLENTHEIIKHKDSSATVQLKSSNGQAEEPKQQENTQPTVLQEDKKPEPEQKEQPAPEDNLSFADKIRDAHLNNPNTKPQLINDEVAKGRPRPEVLKEVADVVKSINDSKPKEPEPKPVVAKLESKPEEKPLSFNESKEKQKQEYLKKVRDAYAKDPASVKQVIDKEVPVIGNDIDRLLNIAEATGIVETLKNQNKQSNDQKTIENGIQKNDAPEGMKSGDIGRGSDGKPYLSKNAALRGLKLNNVKDATWNKSEQLAELKSKHMALIDELKPKKKEPDQQKQNSRRSDTGEGSTPDQVRSKLVNRFGENIVKQLEDNGTLTIVPTYSEQGVEGFAENGKVTLVADAITPDNIVPVFLHELGGHVGMQGTMKPAAYAVLMKEFNRLVKSGDAQALEAKRLAERETDAEVQADEYLPYLITVAAKKQVKQGPVQKLVNRVISAVKAWAVDKLGLDLKLNANDILALAERMIKTIAKNPPPTGPKGRRYSKASTDPQNMSRSKQREFLDTAAKTAFGQMALRGAEGSKTLSSRTLKLFQTMLHKSLTDKSGEFKKTFDLVQGKINHVTSASTRSMDVAPTVLTQLETGSDYVKEVKRVGRQLGNVVLKTDKAKVDTDLDKVGKFMLENTLLENSERHTVKELKQLGFDDDQINIYNEIRDAIDTSLDTFANTTFSNIYKHLGGTNEEVLELEDQNLEINAHYNEILKRIDTLTKDKPEKAEARQAAIEAIDRVYKKANDLKDQGYVPLMRFGKYFVRIYNPTTGEVAFRQHFESESERNLFFRNYDQSKIQVGYEIEQGQINELQYKLFQGVSPETVALFAKESGLPIGDAEKAYIKFALQNNHALKRLLKRQGIDGFDTDIKRVLASFVMSNARYSANQTYNPAIDESITNIKDPAYQEDAIRLRDYSLDTQEELAAFKNFAFVYYMGFSAMFGVVNLTQPFMQTLPFLMQYSKDHSITFKAMGKAITTWRKGTDTMDHKYKAHYERARKEGHLDPQNTWMMQGLERGKSGLGAGLWQLISHASGLFAQASETVNRRTTLFAALDVAESLGQAKLEKLGFKDAYDFAIRTIQETQGIYNKGNRPRVARGNIGSILMMYKQFMISYIEQMARMQKSGLYGGEDDEFKKKMAALVGFGVSRSVLAMLGMLFFFSGSTGLPFMRDILDGIETAGGLVGKPLNTEREIQIALQDALGQTIGGAANTVLMDGAFNLNPVVDVKGRMGMGDLIPVTGYFSPTTSEYMKSAELSNVAGPMGGLVEKVKEAVLLAQIGSYGQAGIQLLPKAITSTGQGAVAAVTGDYRNMKTGVKTNSIEPWEGVLKMMDMQPSSIAKEGRIRGLEMKDKAAQDYVNKRWKERYEQALETGDRAAVHEIKQQIKDYNKENERYPIKFNQKTAETNFKKSNQSWQEKRKNVKGLEWMSEYNPYLDQ